MAIIGESQSGFTSVEGERGRGEGRRGVRKRGRGEGGRGSCKEEGKEVSEFFLYFLKLLSGILQHLNFPRDLSSS